MRKLNVQAELREGYRDALASTGAVLPGMRSLLTDEAIEPLHRMLDLTENIISRLRSATGDGEIDPSVELVTWVEQTRALPSSKIKGHLRMVHALANATLQLRRADVSIRIEKSMSLLRSLDDVWMWLGAAMRNREDVLVVMGGGFSNGIRRRGQAILSTRGLNGVWRLFNDGGDSHSWTISPHDTHLIRYEHVDLWPELFADAEYMPLGTGGHMWVLREELVHE